MAVYNEILAPRFSRMMQKIFSMKGGQATKQLSGELMPVLPLFLGAEGRFLEGWQRFGFPLAVGPTAANVSVIRFRNPVGSNVIAVFEKILVFSTAADVNFVLRHGQTSTDLASGAGNLTGTNFDTRGAGGVNVSPTLVESNQATTAAAPAIGGSENSIGLLSLLANTMADFIVTDIQEFPLVPGDAIQLQSSVVNNRIGATFFWRERFMEESERQ